MKRRILKYKLDRYLRVSLPSMPKGWKFLHFGPDPEGNLCLWAEVDSDAEQSIVSTDCRTGRGDRMNLDEMTLEELRAEVARLREEYEPWAGKLCECGKPATQLFYTGRPIYKMRNCSGWSNCSAGNPK